MVNRPPPEAGSNGHANDEDSGSGAFARSTSGSGGSRRGLEWSLRSLHKIDTSAQHFLTNYYEEGGGSDEEATEDLEDQTAYDIFKGKGDESNNSVWAALSAPLRTGIVDGKKVVFELLSDVTQKPVTPRSERLKRSNVIVNADKSHVETRIRFWMMHFSVGRLMVAFLAAFMAMNVAFAGLFYILEDRCCDDPFMTFGEIFSFAIQTSTTIGYGGFSPKGYLSNCLVVMLNYASTLMNTLFAGLLFTKFVTPVINIQFSEVLTICNVNGVPCLSFRLGNADGLANPLTDINVRLTYSYQIPYKDHKGQQNFFRQTEDLKLLSNRQHGLAEVWTLRHVLDEASPLFGLHFQEHPGNKIYVLTLSLDAVQDLTKSSVNVQTEYAVEDIMIGHTFQNQVSIPDEDTPDDPSMSRKLKRYLAALGRRKNKTAVRVAISDYSKMSDTEPYPVWYPALAGAYGKET
jgi:inward rectifier potassium channel